MNSKQRRQFKRKFAYVVNLPKMDSHTHWKRHWESYSERQQWLLKNVGKKDESWVSGDSYEQFAFRDARAATWFKMRWA